MMHGQKNIKKNINTGL